MELKTKNGHIVKLKNQITGGEYQDIQDILLETTEVNQSENIKMGAGAIAKMRDKSIEMIVLEVDGKAENILQEVRSLPVEDYNQVVEKVNEIRDGMSEEKKTI